MHLNLILQNALYLDADIIFNDGICTCFAKPSETLIITEKTTKDEIKKFAFKDGKTVGFLSYDYGLLLNKVQPTKQIDFPLGMLKKYKYEISFDSSGYTKQPSILPYDFEEVEYRPSIKNKITTSASEQEYINACTEILSEIKQGKIKQLNYAVAHSFFDKNFSPINEFFRLISGSPAKFSAYFNAGRYKVLSCSPERFIKSENGKVLSQPIKGTYKTAKPELEDSIMLTSNPKEIAELALVSEEMKNDISRNLKNNSASIENFKSVFRVNNLLQMYANVCGELKDELDVIDLLLDALPVASISGVPKSKSMRLIDKIEPFSRGIYCGTIFTIDGKKNMDSSVCIRTGVFDSKEKTFTFYSGSGITEKSLPAEEYKETMSKAEKFMEVFE